MIMTNPYENVPNILLTKLDLPSPPTLSEVYCVGFELSEWRCEAYANHLMEWLNDYALKADELKTLTHANSYIRLKEAAARIYTSENYEKRGEVGEISLHAICRQYFDTIPIAPRVFYLTSSNDVVKSFDLVHVRYISEDKFELWLGEAKFYTNKPAAISSAIKSVRSHIDAGLLNNQKLLLGPQVSNDIPQSAKIRELLSREKSLDELFANAVFPIFISADSEALQTHTSWTDEYLSELNNEILTLQESLTESGLPDQLSILLIYVPLKSKAALAQAFDERLKGLAT